MSVSPRAITVYLASNPGHAPIYVEAARTLAQQIAARGLRLVYGGASVGTMGALADAALAAGAPVTGIIVRDLLEREVAHHGLTELVVVETMQERKVRLAASGDAFIVMPGGYGTLEEAFEVLTAAQLEWHHKPIVFCDVDGFYQPLIAFLDHAVERGLLRASYRGLLRLARDPAEAVAMACGDTLG